MTEATVKTLKTAGKVALWIVIPGGTALLGWAIYRHFYPAQAKAGTTVKPADDKYKDVKPGSQIQNPTGLTQP